VLRYFGIDATAALAGLGIGGIAVALSAQKTLENVIGGLSIIFDRAVRVGDFIKVGTTAGTVEYVGLRSTRIRTLDRTVVSVPNGQIATASVETTSDRDKFRFSHIVGVTYDTSSEQLRAITNEIRDRLRQHTRVDDSSIRVRVVRFAPSSIEIEISSYLFAQDWEDFLELQEGLLLDIMAIVERHGSSMAFPTQTVHVAKTPAFT
jgi:MscS family membrane protein